MKRPNKTLQRIKPYKPAPTKKKRKPARPVRGTVRG